MKQTRCRSGLESVQSFGIFFHHIAIEQLHSFGLIVLEQSDYQKEEIAKLKQENKIILAYLNLGEIETYRPFAAAVRDEWIIAANPDWDDHYFVKPGEKGWRELLKQNIILPSIEKGIHGFFLDSVDLAASNRYPEYRQDMIDLIKWIADQFPNSYLVVNNGQFIMDDIAPFIHGLLAEEVFTVQVSQDQYSKRSESSTKEILNELAEIKHQWQLPVFIIDYLLENGSINWKQVQHTCNDYGFLHFYTDQHASTIPSERLESL